MSAWPSARQSEVGLFADLKDMPPRIGLAVTADTVYVIGMELHGFDHLVPMVTFDRAATTDPSCRHTAS